MMRLMTFGNDRGRAATPEAASVMAAMSGGVDSSVCALLLQEAGFDVRGATMVLRGGEVLGAAGEGEGSTCGSSRDVEDARAVCRRLGILHDAFELRDRFDAAVVRPFCDAYLAGRTPNPCIDCNRFLKFEALQKRRREMGLDYVATGHYARRRWDEATGRWQLLRASDPVKDQSYVLYHLTQDTLAHMLFPLGELTKDEVRELARAHGFVTAEKPESQDICFVPDGDYAGFIEGHCGAGAAFELGEIVNRGGRVLGEHAGLIRYTIGQRKGLGLSGGPWFVIKKDIKRNIIYVSNGYDPETQYGKTINMHGFDFITEDPWGEFEDEKEITFKIRHTPDFTHGRIRRIGDLYRIESDNKIQGIAPGQYGVVYDKDHRLCLGSGMIIDEEK